MIRMVTEFDQYGIKLVTVGTQLIQIVKQIEIKLLNLLLCLALSNSHSAGNIALKRLSQMVSATAR